jgi:hypothetical protein
LWLCERFIEIKPEVFDGEDWQRDFVAKGRVRTYFSRDPKALYHTAQHLADDSNMYSLVARGWYAITNLSNKEKFQLLCRLAAITGVGDNWRWIDDGHRNAVPIIPDL